MLWAAGTPPHTDSGWLWRIKCSLSRHTRFQSHTHTNTCQCICACALPGETPCRHKVPHRAARQALPVSHSISNRLVQRDLPHQLDQPQLAAPGAASNKAQQVDCLRTCGHQSQAVKVWVEEALLGGDAKGPNTQSVPVR